jgi:NAD(P)-dependent dehydrogenase (short-subunit alcohol dehydrogenase family)
MNMADFTGKIALVTGASRGIGAAVAIALAARGAHVVITARTQGALEEIDDRIRAAGGTATLLPLDLRAPDTIDPLGPSLYQRFQKLDIFINCAGVLGKLTPVGHITPKDLNECVAVNIIGAARLIRTLAPLLTAAEAGRVVHLTSSVARSPRAFWGAYGATKAAAENLFLSWADEVAGKPLKINVFNPGATATRMRAMAFPGENPDTLKQPAEVAEKLLPLCAVAEMRHGELIRA